MYYDWNVKLLLIIKEGEIVRIRKGKIWEFVIVIVQYIVLRFFMVIIFDGIVY